MDIVSKNEAQQAIKWAEEFVNTIEKRSDRKRPNQLCPTDHIKAKKTTPNSQIHSSKRNQLREKTRNPTPNHTQQR